MEARTIARSVSSFALALIALGATQPALASFHLMQIEQVMVGVNGDPSAQFIQLRMRSVGQHFVNQSRVKVYDAAGLNPILLKDLTTDVTNQSTGDRVLLFSANMSSFTAAAITPDFTLTNLIPTSYFAAGSLTFEDDAGTIYWRLSWGGAAYTGSNAGNFANDSNSNFGPPFASPVSTSGIVALKFSGAASAGSTSNSVDYAFTTGAVTVTNNARASTTVAAPPAPTINPQPTPQSACLGQPASFTVGASGAGTLTYQWQKNNVPLSNGGTISGATTPTLSISATVSGDADTYNVIVTNAGGSTPSNSVSLTVNEPPGLLTSPGNQTVNVGDPVTMTASFSGTVTGYAWRKGGVPLSNGGTISGADTATLSISAAAVGDAGSYDVVATNACGSTPSGAGVLTVNAPPCPWDLNGDSQVDLADISTMLSNYGNTNATPAQGDLNGDHVVDLSDLASELAKYGTHC